MGERGREGDTEMGKREGERNRYRREREEQR